MDLKSYGEILLLIKNTTISLPDNGVEFIIETSNSSAERSKFVCVIPNKPDADPIMCCTTVRFESCAQNSENEFMSFNVLGAKINQSNMSGEMAKNLINALKESGIMKEISGIQACCLL